MKAINKFLIAYMTIITQLIGNINKNIYSIICERHNLINDIELYENISCE